MKTLRRRLLAWCAPDYRELQRAAERGIEAQDRIRELEAHLRLANLELAASRKETTHAVMLVADFMAQQVFGRKVYTAAPDLPEHDAAPELIGKRQQGRALCEELERKFYEQLAAKDEPVQ